MKLTKEAQIISLFLSVYKNIKTRFSRSKDKQKAYLKNILSVIYIQLKLK